METFFIRTEDIKPEEISKYFVETKQDRNIINKIKGQAPIILVGSRGVGKSFLLRIAEYEMLKTFESDKVLPVYITFRKASLIHSPNKDKFLSWMLSRICSDIIRQIRKKGLFADNSRSMKYIIGEKAENFHSKTKIERISEAFEDSWKNPETIIDTSTLPTIDEFVDAIEDICGDFEIERINVLIDEAAHVFIAEQQRQFFTLFRDLRSPYITVNAAVYPGVTIYGDTFQPTHDATVINYGRDMAEKDYLAQMKELVLKQADSNLVKSIATRGEQFSILAYASGGNPRHLLKTLQSVGNLNATNTNNVIREYYRNDIWSEHSILAEKYEGMKSLIDWGRNFIEDSVLPELKRKNDHALKNDEKTTTYFWVSRNSPQLVQEALRILEYTGIVTGHSKGIKATKSEIGNRYCINLGCLFALEPTATSSALSIIKNLSIGKMNEYGANSKAYADVENIDFNQLDNLSGVLEVQLNKSIEWLDLTAWQKGKLREVGIDKIGQVLSASEEKIMEAYYVAEKRARQMRNSAIAAVYEYLAG